MEPAAGQTPAAVEISRQQFLIAWAVSWLAGKPNPAKVVVIYGADKTIHTAQPGGVSRALCRPRGHGKQLKSTNSKLDVYSEQREMDPSSS